MAQKDVVDTFGPYRKRRRNGIQVLQFVQKGIKALNFFLGGDTRGGDIDAAPPLLVGGDLKDLSDVL